MAAAAQAKNNLEFAKQNIGKQYGVLMNGYQKGDWHVTSTIYGPNCTILAPGKALIKGKQAAENYWKDLRDELGVTKIDIKCDELNGSGEWFFERGAYKLFKQDKPLQERVYIKIWRKYEGKMFYTQVVVQIYLQTRAHLLCVYTVVALLHYLDNMKKWSSRRTAIEKLQAQYAVTIV
ncbi:hypothetical protein D917_09147 [Trichinella nativa]|uniref:DUF4440 domain-containing protein n=1 Tax=Trichinella nativa TaxID=6335 RepID=A0A1Y3EHE0_9BILA|nr:hypothetical protein D917_09147 [Trichinella nativa]